MEKCGNVENPLYKLCKLRLPDPTKVTKPEPALPVWVKNDVFRPCKDPPHFQLKPKNERERIFYEENVALNPDTAFKLCCLSVSQGGSDIWHKERKKRITGSKVISQYLIFI